MVQGKFFDERTDQSEVKARIVQKYFHAWARVIADPSKSQMLVALFNDAYENHAAALQSELDKLPDIDKLKYKPRVTCGPVDEDAERYFTETRLVPSFTFVDPFGYKRLSLRIVNGVIKDWGCDCVFFFNYNRINAGISNPAVEGHIDALFGEQRARRLRTILPSKTPNEREALVLEELARAIKGMGGRYVLPFRFKNATGRRTSHSLVFVSKHFKGYEIMKDIMARESSVVEQGVPSLTYSPADASMPLLFSLSRPLDALERMLLTEFSGQTLSMVDICRRHNVDNRI